MSKKYDYETRVIEFTLNKVKDFIAKEMSKEITDVEVVKTQVSLDVHENKCFVIITTRKPNGKPELAKLIGGAA